MALRRSASLAAGIKLISAVVVGAIRVGLDGHRVGASVITMGLGVAAHDAAARIADKSADHRRRRSAPRALWGRSSGRALSLRCCSGDTAGRLGRHLVALRRGRSAGPGAGGPVHQPTSPDPWVSPEPELAPPIPEPRSLARVPGRGGQVGVSIALLPGPRPDRRRAGPDRSRCIATRRPEAASVGAAGGHRADRDGHRADGSARAHAAVTRDGGDDPDHQPRPSHHPVVGANCFGPGVFSAGLNGDHLDPGLPERAAVRPLRRCWR